MAFADPHVGPANGDDAANLHHPDAAVPLRFLDPSPPASVGSRPVTPVAAFPVRKRRPVAWLRSVVDAHGRLQDDGSVHVPLSQAELSEASGRSRNCGTAYAYLRSLAPAVERGRGGIVVDLKRLEALEREVECRRPEAAAGATIPFPRARRRPRARAVAGALPRKPSRGPLVCGVPAQRATERDLSDLLELLVRCQEQLTEAHRRLVELVGAQHVTPP